jgi:hypothetical protein
MALTKGSNSYATVEEAEDYFSDRLDVAAWTSATLSQKAQALVTASRQLDNMSWTGYLSDPDQELAFPRVGLYYDPRVGMEVALPSDVPERVVVATFELAYHLLNNDGLLDDTGTVRRLTVGQIDLDIKTEPARVPASVTNLVRPLMRNGGRRFWWRAN